MTRNNLLWLDEFDVRGSRGPTPLHSAPPAKGQETKGVERGQKGSTRVQYKRLIKAR